MKSQSAPQYRVAIDIGGTFTDIVLRDTATDRMSVGKFLNSHDRPELSVLHGLRQMLSDNDVPPDAVRTVVHATTRVTNAVIERRGVKTALITTSGFRDVLEIGREIRYDLYDIKLEIPRPIVPRELRFSVSERIDAHGNILERVQEAELLNVVEELERNGVEAVAVSLLHSYANAENERVVKEILKERLSSVAVSLSSDISPEIREYERSSTTVLNAYVQPLTRRYLSQLELHVETLCPASNFYVMLSSGGITHTEEAKMRPVQLLESGPAAGALAAAHFGRHEGMDSVIGFDMGGTTAKVCVIRDGKPDVANEFETARQARFRRGSGLPVKIPSVDLIEIGAGGGSIAKINALGLLKVGPEGTSGSPGPACYSLGGQHATVTDADLILGYLNPAYFLGGSMQLDRAAAEEALQSAVGADLGVETSEAAAGVFEVVNENMARALQVHLAEKGLDPRKYALVASGGAGPVHAYEVARKVGITNVIYPFHAGVGSATGLLIAPKRVDRSRTYVTRLHEANWESVSRLYKEMEEDAWHTLLQAQVAGADIEQKRSVEMRYAGQGYSIVVDVPNNRLGDRTQAELAGAFADAYRRLYGRNLEDVAVEVTNWRLTMHEGAGAEVIQPAEGASGGEAVKGRRRIYLPACHQFREVPIYNRYALREGASYAGPAVIEEDESTIALTGSAEFMVSSARSILVRMEASG